MMLAKLQEELQLLKQQKETDFECRFKFHDCNEFPDPDPVAQMTNHYSRTFPDIDSSDESTSDGPNKILVSKIPPEADEELILWFFEYKLDCGKITSVDLNAGTRTAVIEFDDPDAVDTVQTKAPIILSGVTLNVEVYEPWQQCTVKVSGIPKAVSKDYLEFYFTHPQKSGGGDILELEFKEGEQNALITFESEADARRVAGRSHKFNDDTVKVSLYDPLEEVIGAAESLSSPIKGNKNVTSIFVSNLPPSATKEFLEMFFENTRKKGGGPVKNVNINKDDHTAVVEFYNSDAVAVVLKKRPLKIRGNVVEVERYEPQQYTVMVCGLSESVEKDLLEMYFENESKSGGDTVTDITMEEDKGIAYVTFETEKVAARVAGKSEHKIAGKSVSVKIYKPSSESSQQKFKRDNDQKEETDDDQIQLRTVRVAAISKIGHKDRLQYYLENTNKSGGGDILDFKVDEKDDVAFVTFQDEAAARRVSRTAHSLKGVDLDVRLYKPPKPKPCYTDRLIVEGFAETTSNEGLLNFVEAMSETLSQSVVYGEKDDTAMVIFETEPDFEKLVGSCKTRTLEGRYLIVSKVPISNCVAVSNMRTTTSEDTLRYYFENPKRGGDIEKLEMCSELDYGLVYFQDYTVIEKVLQMDHTLEGQKLNIQLYIEKLGIIHGDGSRRKVRFPDPREREIIKPNIKSFISQNKIIEVRLPKAHKYQMKLLETYYKDKLDSIDRSLRDHFVQIKYEKENLSIKGTETGINLAKKQLHDIVFSVQKKIHTLKRPGLVSHIKSKKGQDNIKCVEKLYHVSITKEAEVDEGWLASQTSKFKRPAPRPNMKIRAFCKNYGNRKIYTAEGDMTAQNVDVIVNPVDKQFSFSGGLGKMLVDKGGDRISKECDAFYQRRGAIRSREVFMSTAGSLAAKYIVHVTSPEWRGGKKKEEKLLSEAVFNAMREASKQKVTSVCIPALGCGNNGFPLPNATRTIVSSVDNFFREIQDSSITEVYLIDIKTAIVDAFTRAIKDAFQDVDIFSQGNKDQEKYLLWSESQTLGKRLHTEPKKLHRGSGTKDSGNIGAETEHVSIEIVKGKIANQQVDVIVNNLGKTMNLRLGAASASILKKGGAAIQQQLKEKYPNGLGDGEIAITSGGSLSCKAILHGILIPWDGGSRAIPALHEMTSNCLTEASTYQYSSIAFPALGTGNLEFPRRTVAKEMFSAIDTFYEENPQSSVKNIRFVIYHKDVKNIKVFESAKKAWVESCLLKDKPKLRPKDIPTRRRSDESGKHGINPGATDPNTDDDQVPQDTSTVNLVIYYLSGQSAEDALRYLEQLIDQDVMQTEV